MKHINKKILLKRERRRLKKEYKIKLENWKLKVIERDKSTCQCCNKFLEERRQMHVHHIISLQSVKRNYPELLEDIMNGILFCYYCHKASPKSPHQGCFEFMMWFKNNKQEQYNYLYYFLLSKKAIN